MGWGVEGFTHLHKYYDSELVSWADIYLLGQTWLKLEFDRFDFVRVQR